MAKVRLPYNPNVTADTVRQCLEQSLGTDYTVKPATGPFADWWVLATPLKGATVKLRQTEGKQTTISVAGGTPSFLARLLLPFGLYIGLIASGPIVARVTQVLENDPALRTAAAAGP